MAFVSFTSNLSFCYVQNTLKFNKYCLLQNFLFSSLLSKYQRWNRHKITMATLQLFYLVFSISHFRLSSLQMSVWYCQFSSVFITIFYLIKKFLKIKNNCPIHTDLFAIAVFFKDIFILFIKNEMFCYGNDNVSRLFSLNIKIGIIITCFINFIGISNKKKSKIIYLYYICCKTTNTRKHYVLNK